MDKDSRQHEQVYKRQIFGTKWVNFCEVFIVISLEHFVLIVMKKNHTINKQVFPNLFLKFRYSEKVTKM